MSGLASDLFIGALAAGLGTLLLAIGVINPGWAAGSPKVQMLTGSFGPLGGRIVLAVVGLVLIALGGGVGLGYLGARANRSTDAVSADGG